jgi:hypothetical protein
MCSRHLPGRCSGQMTPTSTNQQVVHQRDGKHTHIAVPRVATWCTRGALALYRLGRVVRAYLLGKRGSRWLILISRGVPG